MWSDDLEQRWQQLADEVYTGMKEWRLAHPRASLSAIEAALDARLASVRARLLQDIALTSAAADVAHAPPTERSRCPECGHGLEARGQEVRTLTTTGDRSITLPRSRAVCPACEAGLFPLDEELGLLPGALTPSLHESLVRLGTWLPFAPAAAMLTHFTGVTLSASTAQRLTEQAGAAYAAVQQADLARLERALPDPPAGPPIQQATVDGVFVPLVGGQWAEVKTLAIGTVQPPVWCARAQEWQVQTTELSYFARLADHETFGWQATVETHRRGLLSAGVVCGVADGADWCQQFYDLQRPDTVRILDFPHVVGYLSQAAQAVWGVGSAAATQWVTDQATTLVEEGPEAVLDRLRALGAVEAVTTALGYLEKRVAQLQYPAFRAAGYPIGSGCGESANKLVVEARLKGSGMHWAREQVDPMLALRTVACSDRWGEAWPQIHAEVRRQRRAQVQARRQARRPAPAPPLAPNPPPVLVAPPPATPAPPAEAPPPVIAMPAGRRRHRPAADHLWRRQRIGRGLPRSAET